MTKAHNSMRQVLIMLILLAMSCSDRSEVSYSRPPYTVVKFIQTWEGYSMRAYWIPSEDMYDRIVGSALIEFKHGLDSSKNFVLSTDDFVIDKFRLNITYNSDSSDFFVNDQVIEYRLNFDSALSTVQNCCSTDPILFQDLNFDERDEVIINEINNGQRGLSRFKVFQRSSYTGVVENHRYGAAYLREPYSSLDGKSEINFSDSTIEIYSSGGACNNSGEKYKWRVDTNRLGEVSKYRTGNWELISEWEVQTIENGDCEMRVWNIIDGEKILVEVKIL